MRARRHRRCFGSDGARIDEARAGLQAEVQGETAEARCFVAPDGSTNTGMPVASRRAVRRQRHCTAPTGNEAPEATDGLEAVDAISDFLCPAAPSGRTNDTGATFDGSTRLSTS